MERYDYAQVWFTELTELNFICTNFSELKTHMSEIKILFPKMRILKTLSLPSNEPYGFIIKGLDGKENDTGWWLIKQLCQQGWEPLGSTFEFFEKSSPNRLHYHFRRRSNV